MFETITLEHTVSGVTTLWLNRADKHNAMSGQMINDLTQAATHLAQDADTRVVVLAARGLTFCAGADLGWMRAQFEVDVNTRKAEARKMAMMLKALNMLPKPLVGRVEGNVFGGGIGLLAVCDVVVADACVEMALTETRLGLIPATIGPYVLARMGEAKAREVFMSGRRFTGEEAVRLNLVARAVASAQIKATVEAEVDPYLNCAPQAVAQAKAMTRRLGPVIDDTVLDASIEALAQCWSGLEAQEGIAAFFERRKPNWNAD